MKNALIIFVRNPELGKVKTRLAAQIGNARALEIYQKLLQHTKAAALHADCDKYVFATEQLTDNTWKDFTIEQQADGDLGKKMLHAFDHLFKKNYEKVVIIGSDCPTLTTVIIKKAFYELNAKDVVIGPAEDGGYYLLGMKKLHSEIFKDKNWSSDLVLQETLISINSLQLSSHQLETLTDVDEEKDLPLSWR